MSNIYLFRGKAATGKSTITDLLCKELNIPVLRKDDIYDKLSMFNIERSVVNSASYDILSKIIQTNIENHCSMIIDIALPHNPALIQFLSKVDLKGAKLIQFLCTCSNVEVWKKRIEQRFISPSPNQYFKSSDEAEAHYSKMEIVPFENEFVLDSSREINVMMDKIHEILSIKDVLLY